MRDLKDQLNALYLTLALTLGNCDYDTFFDQLTLIQQFGGNAEPEGVILTLSPSPTITVWGWDTETVNEPICLSWPVSTMQLTRIKLAAQRLDSTRTNVPRGWELLL